jgi:hypothetical protein
VIERVSGDKHAHLAGAAKKEILRPIDRREDFMNKKSLAIMLTLVFWASGAHFMAWDSQVVIKGADTEAEKARIRSTLERLNQALQSRNIEDVSKCFAQDEEILFIGPDLNEKALGWESLKSVLEKQFKSIRNLEMVAKDLEIHFNSSVDYASYIRVMDIAFVSQMLPFAVKDVRETGLLKRKNNEWVIVQQHTSAPMTDKLWPFYLVTDQPEPTTGPLGRRLNPEKLKEDFDLFRLALEEAHAGLYRYTPKKEISDFFNSLYSRLDSEMSEIEFFRLLSPVIEKTHCLHTAIYPSGTYRKAMEKEKKFFPLAVNFFSGRAYVVRDFGATGPIPIGSEVLTVNGRPMNEVLERLKAVLPSDGRNETYKLRVLDRLFSEKYFLYIGPAEIFEISFRDPGSDRVRSAAVPAVMLETINHKSPGFQELYRESLKLEVMKEAPIAILTVKTFVPRILQQMGFDYARFLEDAFKEIREKNIQHLVIDLRWNDGGEGSAEILTYLLDRPFAVNARIDTPRTRYSFLEFTDKGLFFNAFHPRLWTRDGERYLLKGRWGETKKPQEPHFSGKVYILVNGMSISDTSSFAALAHYHRRAVFIGEETGGGYFGGNSGDYLGLTLPHSKLFIRIPIRCYIQAVSEYPYRDRGVIPDYPVEPTIQDVLKGIDTELEFTLDLIRVHEP